MNAKYTVQVYEKGIVQSGIYTKIYLFDDYFLLLFLKQKMSIKYSAIDCVICNKVNTLLAIVTSDSFFTLNADPLTIKKIKGILQDKDINCIGYTRALHKGYSFHQFWSYGKGVYERKGRIMGAEEIKRYKIIKTVFIVASLLFFALGIMLFIMIDRLI